MILRLVLSLITLTPLCITAQLSINEYSSKGGISDLGENSDWIEIYNYSTQSLNLSGYYLSDDADDVTKWAFPELILPSDELILVCASGLDLDFGSSSYHSLVNASDQWKYFPANSEPEATWNTLSFNDNSWLEGSGGFGYGDEDDETVVEGYPSVYLRKEFNVNDLAGVNSLSLFADYDDGFVAYLNGVEIARSDNMNGFPPLYSDYATYDQEAASSLGQLPEEYILSSDQINALLNSGTNVLSIQVHNVSEFSSDMSASFYLIGEFTDGSVYQPLPLWFSPNENPNEYLHSNFKLSGGESLSLSDGLNVLDFQVIPSDLSVGISRGRYPDGNGSWCYFSPSTPDNSNGVSECFSGITPAPLTTLNSGWYSGDQTVGLNTSEGITRYTTNGNIPQEEDPVFSTAIFNSTTNLSLRSFSENMLPSEVTDRTYIFGQDNHNLPVFSIHVNEDFLFDFNDGIYEFGPNADLDNFPYFGSNFWQPWSRFARLEYFNSEKELLAEEQLDLEIHGGWSRAFSQKSFRLDFKGLYSGELEVPLFSNKQGISSFNNINLRNGGQHIWTDKIQDALFSRLMLNTNVDQMAYEPCILYINGQYWGVYGIREKIDEHYVESGHNINSSEVDLLNSFNTLAGSDAHFNESLGLILSTSPDDENFITVFSSRFDITNYIDYFIAQTYYQNVDWLGIAWGANNIKLWRPQEEGGKWRYIMYDTDAGFSEFWGTVNNNFIENALYPASPNDHASLFFHVFQNSEFKCLFANRYADLINTIWQPNSFNTAADVIREGLSGAMPDHIERWPENVSFQEWQQEIESIKTYNQDRIVPARSHVESTLGLEGQYTITVDVMPEGSGTVKISTVTPENYPWTGVYFNGCGFYMEAIPNDGYSFTNWTANGPLPDGFSESEVFLNLSESGYFIANFDNSVDITEAEVAAVVEVYPNPTKGVVKVSSRVAFNKDSNIKLKDALGREIPTTSLIKQSTENSRLIDLSSQSPGIYFMEIDTPDKVYTEKIIVE